MPGPIELTTTDGVPVGPGSEFPVSSRYFITNDNLRRAALNLQLGQGVADRITSTDATAFVQEGECWAEERIEEYVGVPLKPTRAPGQSADPQNEGSFDKNEPQAKNFPHDFRQAAIYHALSRMLASEYFENSPNASEAAIWADQKADEHIALMLQKRTTRVGAGRLRHPNPHMPPMIAPRSEDPRGYPPHSTS